MKQTVYTVTAYKYGDRGLHSYIVGVFVKKHAALSASEEEENDRGGKYTCEVLGWELNNNTSKIIKPLF